MGHAEDWLVYPKNIGSNLSIDETSMSDGELYTIVSNKDAHARQGTIVAIVKGTKIEDVTKALLRIHWWQRAKVREVTMDLSDSMYSIVEQCFPYVTITIDRFHVQKDCYEAMQQLRVKHRREALQAEAEGREAWRKRNKHNKARRKADKTSKRGRKPNRSNERYQAARLANGDTLCELLARSRYLLMVSAEKWTESQKVRASLLFEYYPDIEEAYGLCHSLRMIFNNKQATVASAKKSFSQWYDKVETFANVNFNTVARTIQHKESEILNYFLHRSTNAYAESLNAKIKNFRAMLHGVVDVKFFLYRLSMIFA